MNFNKVFKVFDTVMSVLDVTKEKSNEQPKSSEPQTPVTTFADQVEMRLTNVVVAALKEAFNRDEARLELERAHLEEQRRRAEETMRMEVRRQSADRELSRLRLLGMAGLLAWITSVVLLVMQRGASSVSRDLLIVAAVLALSSVGSAFIAQAHIGASATENDRPLKAPAGAASLTLLLGGLALIAVSLVL